MLSTVWSVASVLLPVIAALRATVSTNDSAYGVRAGQLMLRSYSILRTDVFTLTAQGLPWLNQQWGAQIILAAVYGAGGWVALALFRAALVGVIFLFVFLTCRARGASPKLAAWLTLASFGLSAGGLALRPQLLGMALFAMTMWLVFDPRRHPRRIWLVPLVALAWANIHGTYFLAWVLLAISWLHERHERSPDARRTLWVLVASVAATLANPFGIRVWTYVIDLSTDPFVTRLVSEWRPPTIRDLAGASFFISAVLVAGLVARRPRRLPGPTLIALLAFFVIGLQAVRGVFWWDLIAPALVVPLLPGMGVEREERPARVNTVMIGALLALIGAFLPWWRATTNGPSPDLVSNAPLGITAELRRVLRPGEGFFNPVPWASWFELALPGHRVFFDPRIEVFPAQVIRDDLAVSSGQQGWQRILDRWNIRVLVADPGEQSGLLPRILRDPGWRLVYRDRWGYVFMRSSG
jgi:hypothetical protein